MALAHPSACRPQGSSSFQPPAQRRSILYASLGLLPDNRLRLGPEDRPPREGDVVQEVVIEVESPVLLLTKPRDADAKIRERAEARRTG